MSYDTAGLIKRIKLKAYTSASTSLGDQDILDLANDSLRSYVVPVMKSLREEFWVGPTDTVLLTDASGSVTMPDSVASTTRTVAWNNSGVLTPLTRIEPELSFQYLAMQGNLPLGFELRGFVLRVLPVVPNIELHLTAMFRPPEMVTTDNAAQVTTRTGATLTLASVPLEWQTAAPTQVDVISSASPFSPLGTFNVTSLSGTTLVLATDPGSSSIWVADVGDTPFPNLPIELHPLLEQDTIVQLMQGLGDKRLAGIEKRRDELEVKILRTLGPRTQGNARPIVNYAAPGMRNWRGFMPRR